MATHRDSHPLAAEIATRHEPDSVQGYHGLGSSAEDAVFQRFPCCAVLRDLAERLGEVAARLTDLDEEDHLVLVHGSVPIM